jgi:uncharacterized protein YjbI with pentapeptide repeats
MTLLKLNMAENYCRAKLRGKSFKGQDLTGADFSYSDIRGADFTAATLKGANFSHAKAGLQRRWAITLVIFALIVSSVSGLLSAVGGSLLGFILIDNNRENIYVGVVSLIVLSVFFAITMGRGVAAGVGFLAVAVTCAGIGGVLWAGVVALAWAGAATTGAMELAAVVAVMVTGAVGVVVVAISAVIIAGTAALVGAIAGLLAVVTIVTWAGIIAGAVAVTASKVGLLAGAIAGFVAVLVVLLSAYVGCRALFGDEKQNFVRKIALSLATRYGTRFQESDLTDADFTQAKLKNSNFIAANLTRTCWFRVKKLYLAAVGESYLEKLEIRQLLITKDLQNKNLDGWNLQGINLQGANFKDASLIAANLSNSNLQDADFSRANLVQTQLDKTDLRGANLTGAYIEDWGVTAETKLSRVKCDYIFMRVPSKENPNPYRLPADWDEMFYVGEFSQLFSPLTKLSKI